MPTAKAQLISVFTHDMVVTLIVCVAIVVMWSVFRPDMVRDSEGRRLPPSITARLTFVILFIVGFLAITMAFHFGGILAKRLSSVVGFGARFFDQFEGQAAVMALLATSGLYSLAPFREIEQHFLSWLHNTRHLRSDVRLLTQHLQDCALVATAEERSRNIASLAAFDVYVTGTGNPVNLNSVTTWRKTASLLHQVQSWNADHPEIMSDEELKLVDELEEAHTRKTRLAMDIIRMLELREGGAPEKALTAISAILSRASHSNREAISNVEAQANAGLQDSDKSERTERPLRLSSYELQEYLKKIESYFHVEYRLILHQIAEVAAKAVLRAGDQAAERLEELKEAGFQGLGTVKPLSAHRIIWFLLSVAIGGFLIYYASWYAEAMRRIQSVAEQKGVVLTDAQLSSLGRNFLIGIAVFVTSIALASLVGAVFGSSSARARARETPWGIYFLAGLVATIAFFAMQLMREAITLSLDSALASGLNLPQDSGERLRSFAPWLVLPFLIAMTICWLARQKPISARLRDTIGENLKALIERLADGILVGAVMIPGFAISIGLIQMLGLPWPVILKPGFDQEVARNLFVFGFLVGFLVVRDVRSAAHAQLVPGRWRMGAESAGLPKTANLVAHRAA